MARRQARLSAAYAGALMTACGWSGTPPERVDAKAATAEKAETKGDAAPVIALPGAIYGYAPECEKCKRTRGDGCVTRLPKNEPLGCGWVAPDGKRAAVAWIVRDAEVNRTLWWYGTDGKTKAFWTPCKDPKCDARVAWSEDGSVAIVSYGPEGGSPMKVRYDVDAGQPVEPDAQ